MRQYYPLMPANGDQGPAGGEQGPPERPDYKVYRSRPGLLSRLRSPDLAKLRERLRAKGPGGPPGRRGEAEEPSPKERPPWRRALKWVGIAALVWLAAQLPCLRGLLPDPEGEAGGHGQHARTATPSCSASRRRSWCWAPTCAPRAIAATGEDAPKKCIDAAGEGEAPPIELLPLPGRHDHAGSRRRLRVPQAVDPARHLRLDPGPRRPEDQRRLRLRRRQARGPDGRAVPGHRRRPGRRGRLQRLPRLHRRDRWRHGGHRPRRSARRSRAGRGTAASASTSIRASTT